MAESFRRRFARWMAIATLALPVAAPAVPSDVDAPTSMTLRQVVTIAFERNLDIDLSYVRKENAADEVTGARGSYDPTLQSRGEIRWNETRDSTTLGPDGRALRNRDRTESTRTEVLQLLPSGAEVGVGYSTTRSIGDDQGPLGERLNPDARHRAFVSIRQPLLKNFGPRVTNAGIRVAEREREIAEAEYQQEVHDQLAGVLTAYWDLVLTRRSVAVAQASLEAARELERIHAIRFETGATPLADLLQAQAQVAAREDALLVAESAVLDAQDDLLTRLNWSAEGREWVVPIEPADGPERVDLQLKFDDAVEVAGALQERPGYRAAELGVDVARIDRDVAKWQRLPQLDLLGEYGFSGYGEDHGAAHNEVTDESYDDALAGVEFRYPLLNRRARATYRQSENELTRSHLLVEQAGREITRQVRGATRQVRTSQLRIVAARAQVVAARQALAVERQRLETGGSTTFNVLRLQEDLADAERSELDALVSYQKGIVELERARGTLVEQLGRDLGVDIVFEDQIAEPRWRRDGDSTVSRR